MNNALQHLLSGLPVAPASAQLLGKATLLLALGWLIHAALGRANPRWRVLLWRVVAAGLMLLPVSVWFGPRVELKVARPMVLAVTPLAQQAQPAHPIPQPVLSRPAAIAPNDSAPPSFTQPAPPQNSSFSFNINQDALIVGLWALGAIFFSLRCAAGWMRLRKIARDAAPAPDSLTAIAARVAWDLGCRGLDLRLTEGISIPFVMGWRRPVLLLPARMASDSYRDQLPAILAHEFSHLRAGDMFWTHALGLLGIVLWFHPLMWPVARAHAAACEEVSDAISASYIGDAGAYSRTLARVAVELAELPPPVGGIAMARVPEVMRRLACLRRHVFAASISRQYLAAFVLFFMIGAFAIGSLRFAYAQAPLAAPTSALKQTVPMAGVVIDARTGEPIKGAKVMWIKGRHVERSVQSGDGGRFAFAAVDQGKVSIAATAPMHAPEIVPVDAQPGAGPVRIALGPGHVIAGRIVDADGKPVPKTLVYPHTWRNISNLFDVGTGCWSIKADDQGRFRWTEAPDDAVVATVGGTNGTVCDTKYPLVPDRELVITVQKLFTVSGQVTDFETGQPIKSFKVAPGTMWRFSTDWWRDEAAIGKDGRYRLESNRGGCQGYQLEFSAEGYQPVVTPVFHDAAGGVVCDVKLRKDAAGEAWLADGAGRPVPLFEKTPEAKVEGRAMDPEGKTHQNLEILMCTPDSYVTVSNGKADSGGGWTAHVYSFEDGRFEMTAPFYPPYEFIVVSDYGYADVNDREFRVNPEIRLKAWGRIEGTLTMNGKPVPDVLLRVKYDQPFCTAADPNRPKVWFDEHAETDASGKFVFERLCAGPVHIAGNGINQEAEVKSSEAVKLNISR